MQVSLVQLRFGDDNTDSDVDILIDLDENKIPDLFAYANLLSYIQQLFASSKVDIAIDTLPLNQRL